MSAAALMSGSGWNPATSRFGLVCEAHDEPLWTAGTG